MTNLLDVYSAIESDGLSRVALRLEPPGERSVHKPSMLDPHSAL